MMQVGDRKEMTVLFMLDCKSHIYMFECQPTVSIPQVLSKYYPGSYFGYDREGAPVFLDPIGQIDFRGI